MTIAPHELADMRRAADKMPFDMQKKFHTLLDAYEDSETTGARLEHGEKKSRESERCGHRTAQAEVQRAADTADERRSLGGTPSARP